MTLFREDLDASGCEAPDCGHDHRVLFLHPRCHKRSGIEVSYDKRTGNLTVACAGCGKHVAEIAVAAAGPEFGVDVERTLAGETDQ